MHVGTLRTDNHARNHLLTVRVVSNITTGLITALTLLNIYLLIQGWANFSRGGPH